MAGDEAKDLYAIQDRGRGLMWVQLFFNVHSFTLTPSSPDLTTCSDNCRADNPTWNRGEE
jgi:hypothetical protein